MVDVLLQQVCYRRVVQHIEAIRVDMIRFDLVVLRRNVLTRDRFVRRHLRDVRDVPWLMQPLCLIESRRYGAVA